MAAALPGGTVSGPLPASLSALSPSLGGGSKAANGLNGGLNGSSLNANGSLSNGSLSPGLSQQWQPPLGAGSAYGASAPSAEQGGSSSSRPSSSPPPGASSSSPTSSLPTASGQRSWTGQQQRQQQQQQAAQQQAQQQQQQQQAMSERDEEIMRLNRLLHDREEELRMRDAALKKGGRMRESEAHQLKSLMTREKEDELGVVRAALTREKDKEVARLEAAHAKQLKAKDEEVAQAKQAVSKERDDKVAKLAKELKASVQGVKDLKEKLAGKEGEIGALRKQLGSAQRVEDDLRKQQASAASAVKAEERTKHDAMARLETSIKGDHVKELRRLTEEHEQATSAHSKEVSQLNTLLKQALTRVQRTQQTLGEERERLKEGCLSARTMASLSLEYTPAQEEALLAKVEGGCVHECSATELHWLMTKPFRAWLAQSYAECDQVCDTLESEGQRLKRLYHTKETEAGRLRAHATQLRARLSWTYRVCFFTMVGLIAAGCAGAWPAISSGQYVPWVGTMALSWAALLATALGLLFGDGGSSPPSPRPPSLPTPRDRTAAGGDGLGGGGDCGDGTSAQRRWRAAEGDYSYS